MGSSEVAVYTNAVPAQSPSGSPDEATDIVAESAQQIARQSELSVSSFQAALEQRFDARLEGIERRITLLESTRSGDESDTLAGVESVADPQQAANELQTQLLNSGFSQGEYDLIANTREELQLKRLQLRDQAIREGWFRSESWTLQSRALNADTALRKKLGDERFDDYLTAIGRSNRVKIDDVMTGSAAQLAGILPGDLIYRYADQRVYLSAELRNMTTAGEAGETTALTVLRDGELLDLSVPRGPLGVMISGIAISAGNP